jgi:hypothetical protein
MARQGRGELAAARGDGAAALAAYQSAYAGFKAANYDYEAARCLTAVAELHRQKNKMVQAQSIEEQARVIFRSSRPE